MLRAAGLGVGEPAASAEPSRQAGSGVPTAGHSHLQAAREPLSLRHGVWLSLRPQLSKPVSQRLPARLEALACWSRVVRDPLLPGVPRAGLLLQLPLRPRQTI
ncbi:unnamed protein product [Rangifer tarandus platyrhynchus]|uniref:Uncharacterized protein n=2 Tax=Rangifer tarandus platyrhynchus TaxID=3082113 RepID=A0ACB0FDR4_RANTA|nr:unnamed protein product [Rangifer tarandus platyrhynchus]CAI9711203.1 unnamed protein product [Rangifer tarandus platyrhynchus]